KKPHLDHLVFRIITDTTQMVTALKNGEVQAIRPTPTLDLVKAVKELNGFNHHIGSGLQWEHLDFNLKNPLLSDDVLRNALFTAIDRKQIIAKTIGQFVPGAKPLNNHVFVPGQKGYQDNVTPPGHGTGHE